MRIEKITDQELVHKLYRTGKIQRTLLEFHSDPELRVVRLHFEPSEYASSRSAHSSYINAIKRLNLPIKARVLDGNLYLIKLEMD